MSLHLVLRDGGVIEYSVPVDLAIENGLIAAIGTDLMVSARAELRLDGRVVLSALVDAHLHPDKAFTAAALGTACAVREASERFARYHVTRSMEEVRRSIERSLALLVSHGVGFVRAHADVDDAVGLQALEALLNARQNWADAIEIQAVAFATRRAAERFKAARPLRRDALACGPDVLGGTLTGCPEAADVLQGLCDLAASHHVKLDLHIDETDDPAAPCLLEGLPDVVCAHRWEGKVTASHCCLLGVMAPVTGGSDNLRDPYNPYGDADPLTAALVAGLACYLSPSEALALVTTGGAEVLGLKRYGLKVGNKADLVVLETVSPNDVVADHPSCRYVLHRGKLVSES